MINPEHKALRDTAKRAITQALNARSAMRWKTTVGGGSACFWLHVSPATDPNSSAARRDVRAELARLMPTRRIVQDGSHCHHLVSVMGHPRHWARALAEARGDVPA